MSDYEEDWSALVKEAEAWKKRAEEWKSVADREATTISNEFKREVLLLKTENKRLRRLLELNGING